MKILKKTLCGLAVLSVLTGCSGNGENGSNNDLEIYTENPVSVSESGIGNGQGNSGTDQETIYTSVSSGINENVESSGYNFNVNGSDNDIRVGDENRSEQQDIDINADGENNSVNVGDDVDSTEYNADVSGENNKVNIGDDNSVDNSGNYADVEGNENDVNIAEGDNVEVASGYAGDDNSVHAENMGTNNGLHAENMYVYFDKAAAEYPENGSESETAAETETEPEEDADIFLCDMDYLAIHLPNKSSGFYKDDNLKDNEGNYHSNAVAFDVNNTNDGIYVDYLLDKKYSTFRGALVIPDECSDSEDVYSVYFYGFGDENFVGECKKMSGGSTPFKFEVPVENITKIRIQVVKEEVYYDDLIIVLADGEFCV